MADKHSNVPVEPPAPSPESSSGNNASPHWSRTTKLVVALAVVVVGLLLLVAFQEYFSLFLSAFLITFLFQPIAGLLKKHLKISWRVSVAIVYFLMAILLMGLVTWGGISLFGQFQNLLDLLTRNLSSLTNTLANWSNQEVIIGPFRFVIPELTAKYLSDLLAERVQPLLGQAGNLIAGALSGGANLLFRAIIMYLISFFVASESENSSSGIDRLELPGYEADIQRMKMEISIIWNAFIRGEFVVVGTAMFIYSILLGLLGMPYFLGLAVIAGLGRFIPYVGAWISWITFGLVAVFANPTPLGLTPVAYLALVVGFSLVVDNLLDNILMPRIMGNTLKVHPAAILITALVASRFFGLIGIVLAAPVFATVKLVIHYIIRKLADLDPWAGIVHYTAPKRPAWYRWVKTGLKKAGRWFQLVWESFNVWLKDEPARKSRSKDVLRSQKSKKTKK